MWICVPLVLPAMAVGIIVALFQALTQIQESTLTFVPKLVGVALVLTLVGNWMLGSVVSFTKLSFHQIESVGAHR